MPFIKQAEYDDLLHIKELHESETKNKVSGFNIYDYRSIEIIKEEFKRYIEKARLKGLIGFTPKRPNILQQLCNRIIDRIEGEKSE